MRRRHDHRRFATAPVRLSDTQITCVLEHCRGQLATAPERRRLTPAWQPRDPVPYPADHGFIPGTIGRGGDPLTALVLDRPRGIFGALIFAQPVAAVDVHSSTATEEIIVCTVRHPRSDVAFNDLVAFGARARERINRFLIDVHPSERVELVWSDQRSAAIAVTAARWLFEDTAGALGN